MRLLALAALALLQACASENPRLPNREAQGTYFLGTLRADVPDPVVAVAAAADDALRDRGYTVFERDVTADRATLLARPSRPGPLERVTIEATLVPGGSRVEVSSRPTPDKNLCLAIMDSVLTRLGR